ncbi:glycosyltransferase family 2 protein [Bacteroides fragilis]
MNNPILLSIVIPVYNVELYIERCLLSCLNQDLSISQYEIILIDDGSPDSSIDKISKWLDRKNITLLTQPNSGLSVARNNGLLHAKGKYVWFVDSDDWILENCLQEIAGYMVAGIDIITFCAADFINDKFYRRFEYITGVNKKNRRKGFIKKRNLSTLCAIFYISEKIFRTKSFVLFAKYFS